MSDAILTCKGCNCAYVRGDKSGPDFCQWCTKDIIENPLTFKTWEQRLAEKQTLNASTSKRTRPGQKA